MSKNLDYNTVAKQYFNVTFADEKKTTIMVSMPTKGLLRELTNLKVSTDSENDSEALEELYAICAKTMSRNKAGKKITVEFLEDIFDFEDIIIFLKEYMDFVGKVAGRKN